MQPNGDDPMTFTVHGFPVSKYHVEGPIAAGYWEAAFDQMEKTGQFERIGERELEREISGHF